jgi:hypothetical protein
MNAYIMVQNAKWKHYQNNMSNEGKQEKLK